jgi:hypothetical protein
LGQFFLIKALKQRVSRLPEIHVCTPIDKPYQVKHTAYRR